MPYNKYRNTGRRVPRRARRGRVVRRRKPMTAGRVKRIIGAELKFRDLGVDDIDLPTVTGSVVPVSNAIGQGDSNSQRTGNWIKPTSFMGTITVEGNPADAINDTQQYRIGIFCWKENETNNPAALAQIMQDVVAPHQQFNIEGKGTFKMLWSRTGIVSTNNDNPQFQKIHRFYVKPPMKILYDAGNPRNNQLFVFGYSNIDTAADPPKYSFDVRLRYTDS